MMKLKKTLCIVLALVMALGLLSACGGGGTMPRPRGRLCRQHGAQPRLQRR
ncbi:MAG: hypothetical protein ACLUEK_06825 [Oscillospiraceae bacterium]